MKKRSCFSLFPLAAAAVSFIAIFCAKQVACDTVDTEDNLSSSLLSSSETQRTPDTLKDLPNVTF